MAGELLAAAGSGLQLGIQFNPVVAAAGAAIAAAFAAVGRVRLAAVTLAVIWLLGDGMRIVSRAADALGSNGLVAGGAGAQWAVIVMWALASLCIGYVLPTWIGAFVGSRVTHGTGWLAAGALAATAASALATLSGVLG
ncbi:MAG: hypothetical protein RBS78_03475 [Coriobacteriia bacterium]|jgi:hypothetical protein|nr:hypothetical protein [Coriobacteriia bacterium]